MEEYSQDQRYIQHQHQQSPNVLPANILPDNILPANVLPPSGQPAESLHPPKRSKYSEGDAELIGREVVKNLSGREKIVQLIDLHAQFVGLEAGATLTAGARNFAQKVLVPFHKCFVEHFDSNHTTFLDAFGSGKFSHSNFEKRCSDRCGREARMEE
jgi:hypothetical protein